MKVLKDGVDGHLGPQNLDSRLAINKVRACNLTTTPGFPVSRGRVIALFTYIILPTPCPHKYLTAGIGQGGLMAPEDRWTWLIDSERFLSAEPLSLVGTSLNWGFFLST